MRRVIILLLATYEREFINRSGLLMNGAFGEWDMGKSIRIWGGRWLPIVGNNTVHSGHELSLTIGFALNLLVHDSYGCWNQSLITTHLQDWKQDI